MVCGLPTLRTSYWIDSVNRAQIHFEFRQSTVPQRTEIAKKNMSKPETLSVLREFLDAESSFRHKN